MQIETNVSIFNNFYTTYLYCSNKNHYLTYNKFSKNAVKLFKTIFTVYLSEVTLPYE